MKKFIISCVAVMLALSMVSCGNSSSSSSEATSKADSSQATSEETSSAAEGETSSSQTTEADSATPSTDDSTQSKVKDGVFSGSGYSFNIDESKWTDVSYMIDPAKEQAQDLLDSNAESGSEIDVTSTVIDCMFMSADDANQTINVAIAPTTVADDVDPALLIDALKTQYESSGIYTIEDSKSTTVNNNSCVTFKLSAVQSNVEFICQTYVFVHSGKSYTITFTCLKENYDTNIGAFDDIINTITFE